MLTLSDLNKAAQIKKAANEAMAAVTNAAVTAGHKIADAAESAKDAVAAVLPTSHRTLDNRTVDILTVVAGLEQRVESIEEEMQMTTEVDHDKAVVRAQGLFAQMKARKEAKVEEPKAPEAPVQQTAQPRTVLKADAPVAGRVNAGKAFNFDAVPRMDQL